MDIPSLVEKYQILEIDKGDFVESYVAFLILLESVIPTRKNCF
jgi:hypothetical protein